MTVVQVSLLTAGLLLEQKYRLNKSSNLWLSPNRLNTRTRVLSSSLSRCSEVLDTSLANRMRCPWFVLAAQFHTKKKSTVCPFHKICFVAMLIVLDPEVKYYAFHTPDGKKVSLSFLHDDEI